MRLPKDDNHIAIQSPSYLDEIGTILFSEFTDLRYVHKDDFSEGFQGWQYQHDTTGRTGITLTEEARLGNYALQLHTRKTANDECWTRKGLRVPDGVSKVVFGCYWTFHATTNNNPAAIKLEFDSQDDTTRKFFSVRLLHYSGGVVDKWQVNTGTSATYTDVTDGAEEIGYNESRKPMLCHSVVVIDFVNKKYEKLYSNGNVYDLASQNVGPGDGAFLSDFKREAVNIYTVQNRNDSNEEGIMTIEKPFLGYIF